eukprot:jgi/Undpi1/7157/HiC_scaffold_22.g09631.m1
MDEIRSCRRAGRKRARTGAVKVAVSLVLLAAPPLPSADALKLASISEDRRHLGVGLLRAVEVVRGRYERAWALVSASEPSTGDLDTALELLQANAKQWESLEPAVKLWTERDNEGPREGETAPSKQHSQGDRGSASSEREADITAGEAGSKEQEEGQHEERAGAPGVSDTTSRIYEEAASLLAHNKAVLGQALARAGRTNEGIVELEAACPEILQYQQNAQGRRDSKKSWIHCYANLAEMYKTQKRFEDASSLLAAMPFIPNPQQASSPTAETTAAAKGASTAENTPLSNPGSGDQIPAAPLAPVSRETGDTATTADDGTHISTPSNPEDDGPPVKTEGTGRNSSSPREGKDEAGDSPPTAASKGESGRSDASPARGAGAARVAGLNKAAVAASAAAAAESAAAAAALVETGAEAAARAVVERHAEAMRSSMNELVGELAVTTATRPSASQDWLDSRVVAAEEILAAVRVGLLAVAATSEQQQSVRNAVPDDVPALPVGAPGHADILREASHYLSAIKGVAGQGWAYVDNELNRMERHPAAIVRHGFQSRLEVIHTFRYLLMKARQYASENQAQTTAGSGSGTSQTSSRLRAKNRRVSHCCVVLCFCVSALTWGTQTRRHDLHRAPPLKQNHPREVADHVLNPTRGRKASASSKAPRKGGAARKQSARSQDESSSKHSDGLLTLFVGAGVALFVAAVSSGRVGSQGRRREVGRQRTATRAAKTVGRYVEPPQRGAVLALLVHLWGNLKSSAILMRTLMLTAWAAVFERLRTALDRNRADAGGKALSSSSSKKSVGSGQGHHKQRNKKAAKKTPPPPAPLSRQATVSITPPTSPPRRSRNAADAPRNRAASAASKADVTAAAAVVASIGDCAATEASILSKTQTSPVESVPGSDLPATEEADERQSGPSDTPAISGDGVASGTTDDAAMVEEDEQAWEQARLSEKLHTKANAASAVRSHISRSTSSGSGAAKRTEAGVADVGATCGLANDGWSEVVGGGSRARSGAGGGGGVGGGEGARGRVLSMRNVRAVARASRPSSPGSDPATTTSASSSECSEGSKDNPRHRHSAGGRGGGGGRGRGGAGGRTTIGTGKGPTPRAGNKSTWGVPASRAGANSSSGGSGGGIVGSGGGGSGRGAHATRPAQGRGAFSRAPTRHPDQAYPRTTSSSNNAPWATPSPQASGATGRPQPPSATSTTSATVKSASPSVDSDSAKAAASAKLPLRANRSHANVLRQPLRAKAPVAAGKVAEVMSVEGRDAGDAPTVPPAVFVETAPAPVIPPQFLPPSEESFPPPSAAVVAHMPSAAASPMIYTAQAHPAPLPTSSLIESPHENVDGNGNDDGSGDGEAPHFQVVEGNYDAPGMPAVVDDGCNGGSNDGSGGGSSGQFSPGAAVLQPPQVVVLQSPQEQQQQQGHFPPLVMLPSEDGCGGGGGGSSSVVFGQGSPVGYSPTAGGGGGGSGEAGEAFEALMGALCWQVEYYFSADNLVNDAYLRGLMDSEGFVAVSKIMVFNRVRCMTSDMSLLVAALRRSTALELRERDNSGEVRVRTVHSPLHWTREQVPPPKAPPAVAMEPEHVPYEAEEVGHQEKPAPIDEGDTVMVSCEPVSCEPQRDGQE